MFRVLVMILPLVAAPPDFKHVGGSKGVEVFRQVSSPVIDLYAEGDIDAPPAVVRDVLLDYEDAAKVTKNVRESRVLAKNNREILVYQRLKLPIISDRDFTLRATWGQNGSTLTERFTVDNSRGPAAQDGVVRISLLQGDWALDPIREGAATHARYHVQIDLAGSVPKWMVSGGAAKNIPKLYEGVRHEAAARAPGTPVAGRKQDVH
jgi:Polyketide cyclase / dehydrase and lipid transport